MCTKYNCTAILLISLFACFSCGEEHHDAPPVQIPVEHIFEMVITDMVSSSPICLPNDGTNFTSTIINSKQEFINYIPSSVIKDIQSYEDIDYSKYSLISVKFRCFYKPYKLEYKISKDIDGKVTINQMVYATEPINFNGYFVMSNLVTDKIAANTEIFMWQSLDVEGNNTSSYDRQTMDNK